MTHTNAISPNVLATACDDNAFSESVYVSTYKVQLAVDLQKTMFMVAHTIYSYRPCSQASFAKNTPPARFKNTSSLGVLSTLRRKSKKAREIILTLGFAADVG